MKKLLIAKVAEIVKLLRFSGWNTEAQWFDTRRKTLLASRIQSESFQKALHEIEKALFGMGSFTDLPLQPAKEKMSEYEIRVIQRRLAEDMSELIDALSCHGSS